MLALCALGSVFTFSTACSSLASREDERETSEKYLAYAGDPVEQFSFLGRLDRWRALGRDRLVVWTALDQAYLLTVGGGCPDLPTATEIGVTSKTGQVSRGFDSVLLPNRERCMITEIRPIDTQALKQEEQDTAH